MRFIFKVWKQSEEYQWGFAHGIIFAIYVAALSAIIAITFNPIGVIL